eukprot:COSAG06_NODE_8091_length_2275_cov_2.380515_2_plen_76_part_00
MGLSVTPRGQSEVITPDPEGDPGRGISPPWTALAGMGMDAAVLEQIQQETVVMVQLESEEAYKNLAEIAAVPGKH